MGAGLGKRGAPEARGFPAAKEKRPGGAEVGGPRGRRRIKAAGILADKQQERPWQVWIRVHLGGERRIDIARAYGYKDGSAITQMLKRLGSAAQSKPALATRMSRLETEIDHILSGLKS